MNFKPEQNQKPERPRRTRQQKSRTSPNSKLLNAAWPKAPSTPTRQSQIKAVNHDEFAKSWSHWRQQAALAGGECSIEDMEVDIEPEEESKNKKVSPKSVLSACQSKSSSAVTSTSSDIKEKNTLFVKQSFSSEDNRPTVRTRRILENPSGTSSVTTTTRRSMRSGIKSDKEQVDIKSSSSNVEKLELRQDNAKKDKENKALFIIIHVSKVEIGHITGPATSPVKVYADKFMVKMENSTLKKDISFRVPCKHISSLQVSLKEKPFLVKFESKEIQYIQGGPISKKSNKGQESETVTLHLAYEESVPADVQKDLKELVRLAEKNLWPPEKEDEDKDESTILEKDKKSAVTKAGTEVVVVEKTPREVKLLQPANRINTTNTSVRKRTPLPIDKETEKEENTDNNKTKFARRTNQELNDAYEERVKTLSHEAAHYQMVSAQQRMILQSLEEELRQKTRQSRSTAVERSREREDASKLMQDKDAEKQEILSQLDIERDLIKNLEEQLESAQQELREKERLLQEKDDSLRVRDETIQQLRSTMRRHSVDEKEKGGKATEAREPTVPLSTMEETRQHLMQMQVSKEHLAFELQRTQQDLLRQHSDSENLRMQVRDARRELLSKSDSLAQLRTDFITSQEELVSKNEQVRSLTAQLAEERSRNSRGPEQLRTELNNTQTEVEVLKSELTEVRMRLSESRERMNDRQNASRDWLLGRGEIVVTDQVIGIGAWGNVKVGKFRGTEVAVKQIHLLILSAHNRRLFEREMAIASRCRHPCLVQFIGATNDDGTPLFVMERLENDLRSLLSREALQNQDCLQIGFDTIRALNYLHQSKPVPIIHRDLSSSNILLHHGKDGWRGKLSDYGAANFMRLSMTRHPGATLYSAPEASTNDQTTKLDVYSFGVLFCEMCTRELPVPENRQEQVDMVTNSDYNTLIKSCLRRDIPKRLGSEDVLLVFERWISQMETAKKPAK